jgi:type IV secretory pathway protease TraF
VGKKAAGRLQRVPRNQVAEGNYFVVGDNLQSSFDSRVGGFGPVTASMIRGKPLFLYWSPMHSRIGCALR